MQTRYQDKKTEYKLLSVFIYMYRNTRKYLRGKLKMCNDLEYFKLEQKKNQAMSCSLPSHSRQKNI